MTTPMAQEHLSELAWARTLEHRPTPVHKVPILQRAEAPSWQMPPGRPMLDRSQISLQPA